MDLNKIFIKDANPVKTGGQAVLDGIMMRGEYRSSVVVRLPDGSMHIKTQEIKNDAKWKKVPVIRGAISFFSSLVSGMRVLMYSADVLSEYEIENPPEEGEPVEPGRLEKWLAGKFGEKGAWDFMLVTSVIVAVLISIFFFVMLPTWLVGFLKTWKISPIALNLIEGVSRIVLFVAYVIMISKMEDINRTFQFHGAEHKCIHCFENGLKLTPENCQKFYTLHPRCGTSFLMFVMVISLIVFSFLGWPNIWLRIISRLLLLPLIAGLSYELLKWAGRSDNRFVKILSIPGLYLQKLTTREPDVEQLEVAIAAMKAAMCGKDEPCIEGICDKEGKLIKPYVRKAEVKNGGAEKPV